MKVIAASKELNEELLSDHKGEQTGWYFVGENKYLLPSKYEKEMKYFYECSIREDDIWISTFPRSGTTLTQELVWILKNDFDFETAKKLNLWERSPFFEINLFFHDKTKSMFLTENAKNPENQKIIEDMSKPGYEILETIPSPRVIKTHFSLSLLPKEVHEKQCRIIYVARNPKHVVVSYYHLLQLWRTSNYVSPFTKFWKQFKKGYVPWGPFWSHVLEGWNHRNDTNVLFLFYEDMIKDIETTIYKIADFLSVPAPHEKVRALSEHLSIKSFCRNPAVNFEHFRSIGILTNEGKSFVRTGVSREKPDDLNEEIENNVDEWTNENYKKTDLRFPDKVNND